MECLRFPSATYRLQFNRDFGFNEAARLVPYLQSLGIGDLYASPLLKARTGSEHGYDVTDPTQLNPELGSIRDFEDLAAELGRRGMGLLLDIVPNHMAATPENPWWWDVLEHGRHSRYASVFQIDWTPSDSNPDGRLVLPVVDRPVDEAVRRGVVRLMINDFEVSVACHDLRFPIDVRSYGLLLQYPSVSAECSERGLGDLLDSIQGLPLPWTQPLGDPGEACERRKSLKEQVLGALQQDPALAEGVLSAIAALNRKPESVNEFLDSQAYRLMYWRDGLAALNYRRFFDISDLVGVRIEDEEVFLATHQLVCQLVQRGRVNGLRVDHIDGLRDPRGYLRRLNGALQVAGEQGRRRCYLVVEKILTGDERLPDDWPIEGSTGYEFLNQLDRVYVDPDGFAKLGHYYRELGGWRESFDALVREQKRRVMSDLFEPEVNRLVRKAHGLVEQMGWPGKVSSEGLRVALIEVTACLPVYRTYVGPEGQSEHDTTVFEESLRLACGSGENLDSAALDFVADVLLRTGGIPTGEQRLDFMMDWQQFSGAVMAKGLEDTALYRYPALVSLNEVGGKPGGPRSAVSRFHERNTERLDEWPRTLNATATHDTKRGEDVRSRISVLSEMADVWIEHVDGWRQWNRPKRQRLGDSEVPDIEMELLLYQTLVGAWPFDEEEVTGFTERLKRYAVKAAREAKSHTSWLSPDEEYEGALLTWIDGILDDNNFLDDLLTLHHSVAWCGAIGSLSRVVLKAASPGIPDLYQGTELWDLSLVDPDNRRRVDFEKRSAMLNTLGVGEPGRRVELLAKLLEHWQDGCIKMYITQCSLEARAEHSTLFARGSYVPLGAEGEHSGHICAFARVDGDRWALAVAPRLVYSLSSVPGRPLGHVWKNTTLPLPVEAPAQWENAFTGEYVSTDYRSVGLPLAAVFATSPVSLLLNR